MLTNKVPTPTHPSRTCFSKYRAPAPANLNGACILTATGEEIPITEAMILTSLAALIHVWEQQRRDPTQSI